MARLVALAQYLQAALQLDGQVSLRLIPPDFTSALLQTLGERLL